MPFNGSGTYTRTNGVNTGAAMWQADRDQGTSILASRHDVADQDIATALSLCVTKDGQNAPTANIPFGNFLLTGLGAGTARTHSANVGQIQDSVFLYGGTTGNSGAAYTAAVSPAITAYVTGQMFAVKINATNTTGITINFNGVGAATVFKGSVGGLAGLAAGDVVNGGIALLIYTGTAFVLLNPTNSATGTYTPTLTNGTNVAGSTAALCNYVRTRDMVTVSGGVTIDPTAASVLDLGMSLPIASNLGATTDLGGTAVCDTIAQSLAIYANQANDRATITGVPTSAASGFYMFQFMYRII